MHCGLRRLVPVIFALACLGAAGCATSPTTTAPPNVVFILVDDLGWSDLACYGSDLYETPNLDRLARQGMRFTDAYAAAAVCSPTRASIMTGKYPARLHITDWIPGVRYPHAKLTTPAFCQEMALDEVTIAEALHRRGYVNLHVGKWHLGDERHGPLAQGFDVNIGGHAKGAPATYFHPYRSRPGARVDWSVLNLPPGGEAGEYLTDRLGDEAVRLLETQHDRPFFLHLSFYTVHTPIEGKPDLVARYESKLAAAAAEPRQRNATYAAMVHSMDENVGRVLDALDRLGLADNTLVIFTGDNGGLARVTNNAPLRAGKGWLYEGGIREPLIVRWPGVVPAGSTSPAVVTSVDFYPTIVEATGVSADAARHDGADGQSLLGVFRDPTETIDRDAIFWHYPHYHTPKKKPTGAVRAGDWKLIEPYETGVVELYHLRSDPGERHDLSEHEPQRADRLRRALDDWRRSVGASMPVPNDDFDPDRPFRDAYTAWDSVSPPGLCGCAVNGQR